VAENRTRATKASVTEFINSIEDRQKRADARKVAAMMRRATGKRAKMWGCSAVGLGACGEGDFEKIIGGSVKYMRKNYETW